MNIFELVALVRRSWILLIATTLAGLLVGLVMGLLQSTTYTASTEVYVAGVPAEGTNAMQAGQAARDEVQSFVEIATSSAVLDDAAKSVGGDASGASIAGEVTAEAPLNTAVIRISVTDRDPERAAKIADATAASLSDKVEELGKVSSDASSSVKLTQLAKAAVPTSRDGSILLHVAGGGVIGFVLGYVVAVVLLAIRRGAAAVA